MVVAPGCIWLRSLYPRLNSRTTGYVYLSNPKLGHTTGGSGRAAPGGAAARGGPGKVVADGFVRAQHNRPSCRRAWNTTVFYISSEASKNEILCKRLEEQKLAVDNRFIRGTRSALCVWLLMNVPTTICLCRHFPCKACPGTYRLEARVAEARVAWFYAARLALRVLRSSRGPSVSVARFPQGGYDLFPVCPAAAGMTPSSCENCGWLPTQKRTCSDVRLLTLSSPFGKISCMS